MTHKLITVQEAAQYLQLTESSIYRMVKQKLIPSKKVGGRVKILKNILDDWMENGQERLALASHG